MRTKTVHLLSHMERNK